MNPCLGILLITAAQKPEAPSDFVNRFIKASNAGEIHAPNGHWVTGEAESLPDSLGQLKSKVDKLLTVSPTAAVARVQPTSPGSAPNDVYLFLNRSGKRWQVAAVRLLALGGLLQDVYDQLRAKSKRTSDEEDMFQNAKLTLSTDAELAKYFLANKVALEGVAKATQTKAGATKKEIARLHLTSSSFGGGIVSITIGGVLDNEVGFMKVIKGKAPEMNPHEYIWIEPLAPGWYLYKTT